MYWWLCVPAAGTAPNQCPALATTCLTLTSTFVCSREEEARRSGAGVQAHRHAVAARPSEAAGSALPLHCAALQCTGFMLTRVSVCRCEEQAGQWLLAQLTLNEPLILALPYSCL